MNIIHSQQDILSGLEQLKLLDPDLIPIIEQTPHVPLRRELDGFLGLVRVIIGQHVSTASASAIHGRFSQEINPITPTDYLNASEETLIKIGLTRAKQTTIANVATAILSGTLDLNIINTLPEKQAIAKLTALKGIGPWTAEVYLLFCAGHPDIFAAGDLAVREAVRHAYNMDQRPSEKTIKRHCIKMVTSQGYSHTAFLVIL